MKKVFFFLALMLVVGFTSASAQTLEFSVVNQVGFDLSDLYVSPANQDAWGEDLLPGELFSNETEVQITVPVTDETICTWDIKITDLEGNAVMFYDVDFCVLAKITLHGDGTFSVE